MLKKSKFIFLNNSIIIYAGNTDEKVLQVLVQA